MITLTRSIGKRLNNLMLFQFSNNNQLINAPSQDYLDRRTALKHNLWREPDPTHLKSQETHLSNAEYLIHKAPIVYTDQNIVRCMGGVEIGPGHPPVYIQLNTRNPGEPVYCKYCGMRYALRPHN